ncbi:hypothetical protein B566_EDAN011403 [Ephemera danica]|nr:hypothetical protein B566_EDAN011403 [Ephemera danica]
MKLNNMTIILITLSIAAVSSSTASSSSIATNLVEYSQDDRSQAEVTPNGCECADYTCGCCAHVDEHRIHVNTTVCTNITYLNEDYGISFTVTWNGIAIYNETISARNPPPYCVGAPYVMDLADVCLRLHDVDATRHRLHACVELEARLHHVRISKYELGCFTIGKAEQPNVIIV